jgi:hypothetical protein
VSEKRPQKEDMQRRRPLTTRTVVAAKQKNAKQAAAEKPAARKQAREGAIAARQTLKLGKAETERPSREPDKEKKVPAYVLARQAKKLEAERKAQEEYMSGAGAHLHNDEAVCKKKTKAVKGKKGKPPDDEDDLEVNMGTRSAQARRGSKSVRILPQQGANSMYGGNSEVGGRNGRMVKKMAGKHVASATNAFSALGTTSEESDNDTGDSECEVTNECRATQADSKVKTVPGAVIVADMKEVKFSVPRGDVGLVRGYGNHNLRRAESMTGIQSVKVRPDGCVTLTGRSIGALHTAKRALEVVVRIYTLSFHLDTSGFLWRPSTRCNIAVICCTVHGWKACLSF